MRRLESSRPDPEVYSITERTDGSFQLKAGKWPLYRSAGDAGPKTWRPDTANRTIIVAFDAGLAVGIGALLRHEDNTGKLKRMYIRPIAAAPALPTNSCVGRFAAHETPAAARCGLRQCAVPWTQPSASTAAMGSRRRWSWEDARRARRRHDEQGARSQSTGASVGLHGVNDSGPPLCHCRQSRVMAASGVRSRIWSGSSDAGALHAMPPPRDGRGRRAVHHRGV